MALIAKGWVFALITLGLIIAVQQLEAHVLQPLVMGRAVSIHPLAVVLAIAGGGVLAGIVGALLAVPTVAFLNSAVRVLLADDRRPRRPPRRPKSGPVVEGEADDVEEAKGSAARRPQRSGAICKQFSRHGVRHAVRARARPATRRMNIAVGVSRRHSYIDPAEFRHIVVSPELSFVNTVGFVR